jgi:hypothetical protein
MKKVVLVHFCSIYIQRYQDEIEMRRISIIFVEGLHIATTKYNTNQSTQTVSVVAVAFDQRITNGWFLAYTSNRIQ